MMLLTSDEATGKRTYLANDRETWYEVKAQIRGRTETISDEAYEQGGGEVRTQVERHTRAQLQGWFADEGDDLGLEPFGPISVYWEKATVTWSPEDTDEDGEPLEYFEPFTVHTCIAERAFWPPEPVDPHPLPDDPMDPLNRPPRASDFLGDWKA